jgi:hypothetical protein
MKKVLLVAMLATFATVTAVFAQEAAVEKKAEKTSVVYSCDKCQKVALKSGKCCEQDMTANKVLAVKDGNASCCACAGDCKCTLKEGDATKCSCGKDVKKVSLKGMCCCDKDCVIADKEGKCPVCGGDLKAVPAEASAAAPAVAPAVVAPAAAPAAAPVAAPVVEKPVEAPAAK